MALTTSQRASIRWKALTDKERETEAGARIPHISRTYEELVAAGRIVEFPELPDCDVCIHIEGIYNPTLVGRATADSATTTGKWGYTCEKHASYRVGQITWLVAVGTEP